MGLITRPTGRATSLMALAAAAALALATCGSPAASSTPGAATNPPPGATTSGGDPTDPPIAGEPCSFLTADTVGAIVGTTPVEVAERPGRGDCDYWLTAAKDEKVNIGVTIGPDGPPIFESTKGLGDAQALDLGDDSYSIYNETIGTLVMVQIDDAVLAVQVATSADATNQRAQAIRLAEAVIDGL